VWEPGKFRRFYTEAGSLTFESRRLSKKQQRPTTKKQMGRGTMSIYRAG
jgi:hypothetical protein